MAALPPLREVIRRHGLVAHKRLGQHFLLDPSILASIARAAEPLDGRIVLEVGPGPGGLTRALLASGVERVVAVEQDARCVAALGELVALSEGRLELVQADARKFELGAIAGGRPVSIVANLPYNVGTELLLGWLHKLDRVERMVLMFQREVALRLAARPGEAAWGRLGVLAQSLCRVERLFDLPAAAFVPPPSVASSIVRLTPLQDRPPAPLVAHLEIVTRAAFGQRRKMLRSALRAAFAEPETALAQLEIAPSRRAETLSLAEFLGLARAHAEIERGEPQRGIDSRN
jgi:16S rRNA (adenine1518-N6/adenine1519-N6)-dimethyltransferase